MTTRKGIKRISGLGAVLYDFSLVQLLSGVVIEFFQHDSWR